MKVFLSWSGSLSHDVANALNWWLPNVLQSIRPWLSSEDIDKGSRWFQTIGTNLADTSVGILCLTAQNKTAPWVLFEAGALSKSLDQARVCTLLIDIGVADLQGPLAQFNATRIDKDDLRKLVSTLNDMLDDEKKRTQPQLDETFAVWWPSLEGKLQAASKRSASVTNTTSKPKHRSDSDILAEVLEISRTSAQEISRLSARLRHDGEYVNAATEFDKLNAALRVATGDARAIDLARQGLPGILKDNQSRHLAPHSARSLVDFLRKSEAAEEQRRSSGDASNPSHQSGPTSTDRDS